MLVSHVCIYLYLFIYLGQYVLFSGKASTDILAYLFIWVSLFLIAKFYQFFA